MVVFLTSAVGDDEIAEIELLNRKLSPLWQHETNVISGAYNLF